MYYEHRTRYRIYPLTTRYVPTANPEHGREMTVFFLVPNVRMFEFIFDKNQDKPLMKKIEKITFVKDTGLTPFVYDRLCSPL